MNQSYVEKTPQGGWRITGTRVSLDSLVHAYWEGRTPEAIAVDFPTISLEQIHGAIAFYLGNRQEIDAYLSTQGTKWEALRIESETRQTEILQRLRNTAGKSRPTK